ncbi:response regulator [Devosia sp. PTR5]|uniref:Response regulator n=1 Tax=Devosia oryzisoli TaxID=2774138 RepID=A0A927FVH4_9HYPH|nr:response regulator [Devosia oryzisoli]
MDIEDILKSVGCQCVRLTADFGGAFSLMANQRYDLVTLDLGLPDQQGEALAEALRVASVPILYISAWSASEYPNAPQAPWVSRPFTNSDLVQAALSASPRPPAAAFGPAGL